MIDDLAQLTAFESGKRIAAGELHPSELVDACIARCANREPEVRAWAYLDADKPAMAGRLLDAADAVSPLHGIPFGVKDIIDTQDMPTGLGTPIYHGHQPARDAACVALLREAGGICFGKTVTTELAHFHPGKTRNPAALGHTPGGSSSGSAAAVAAGMVPVALGTQTTGSVLRPASYCGVYGFKPSYGDVLRSGVFECSASFDTLGWFARCLQDIEIVRLALLRSPVRELQPAALGGLRVGLFRGPHWAQADPATRDAIESAAARLQALVESLTEIEHDVDFVDIDSHHRTIAGYEFARSISWERTQRGHQLSPKLLLGRCEDGMRTSYEEFAGAQAALAEQRINHAKLMQQYDVLLTPSAPGEAWPGLLATGDPVFNTAWTALHVPVLSVPAFRGATGLPVGLQMVGGFRADRALLVAAAAICAALDVGTVAPAA
ncbi:MAG: amidase [Burkholderiaceae bacterium]